MVKADKLDFSTSSWTRFEWFALVDRRNERMVELGEADVRSSGATDHQQPGFPFRLQYNPGASFGKLRAAGVI